MEKYNISRKERRKAEQNKLASEQLRKSTTVLSSAIVVSSIAAPIAAPKIAEATEEQTPSAQVGYSDTQTYTDAVQVQGMTADSNDSMTQETQTINPETDTSDSQSETQDSSELSTSETTSPEESTTTETTTDTSTTAETEEFETPSPELSSTISAFSAQTRSFNPSAFIAEIAGHAQSVAAANDLYASVMMAQAILESDWGRSTLSTAPNYNLFGIKGSYQGQSVSMLTWEVFNGQWVQVTAAFRRYPSFSESFGDNAYVLRNTSFQAGVYFYSGAWKSNTTSYRDATAWLTGRYATDPSYNTKLNNIITTYNLTQYDTPSSGGNTGSGNTGGSTGGNTGGSTGGGSTTQDVTHTVKAGDSLWALAAQYGTSVANIKSWNNLSGDMIYVGQKLIVGKGSGSTDNSNTGGNTGGSSNGNAGSGSTSTSNTYYTVKSGDSLWAIANANGVSVANLRQWNNLSGDTIFPGQRLIVKQGSSSGNTGGSTGGNTGGSTGSNSGGSSTSTTNTYYTVKSGDSLWAIANANGISIANLRQWNNLSGDIIFPGQRLVVKQGSSNSNSGSSTGSTGNTGSSNNSSTASYYTVKSGDSLWAIANANGTSVANLRQWNNISGDIIFPGQRLIVKQGNGSSASSSSQGSSSTSSSSHKVKSGDTLWGLAQTYGTSVQKIKQLNGLSSDIIYIGQTLKVK